MCDAKSAIEGNAADSFLALGIAIQAIAITESCIRAVGLWIYPKPEEFEGNPAHVVICAPDGMSKSQCKRRSGRLASVANRVRLSAA